MMATTMVWARRNLISTSPSYKGQRSQLLCVCVHVYVYLYSLEVVWDCQRAYVCLMAVVA